MTSQFQMWGGALDKREAFVLLFPTSDLYLLAAYGNIHSLDGPAEWFGVRV